MLKSLIPSRLVTIVSAAVRSVVSPASLMVEAPTVTALDPAGLYEADEVPPVADIEAAAAAFDVAAQQARAGDRGKRAAKKILDRLPAGRYGSWLVSRTVSNRQTADLDKIRAIFKEHGLGPVPMKSSAPSLKVERLAEVPVTVPTSARVLVGATAGAAVAL
ncbi:hypothetical protein AB0407_22395 [Streptomyces microflavus]|uniref:hypothetical protein n=1 Tax=Streptomyces microflavus TaxID=1919 RepID=UPI00344DD31A